MCLPQISLIAVFLRTNLIGKEIYFPVRLTLHDPLLDSFAMEAPLPPDFKAPQLAARRPKTDAPSGHGQEPGDLSGR